MQMMPITNAMCAIGKFCCRRLVIKNETQSVSFFIMFLFLLVHFFVTKKNEHIVGAGFKPAPTNYTKKSLAMRGIMGGIYLLFHPLGQYHWRSRS